MRRGEPVNDFGVEEWLALGVNGAASLEKSKMMVAKVDKLEVVVADSYVLDSLLSAITDDVDARMLFLADGASVEDVVVDHVAKLKRKQEEGTLGLSRGFSLGGSY